MAETKAKKNKPGIVRRIFKWIGLTLLSLLLIAALIFQAPWKVITLLLIILLSCTALPKPARKWFWLSAAAVVIALIIWVFLPDDNESWRPYTFDKELAALEAKYAIPDSENAAIIYNQLLEDYDESSLWPDFLDDDLDDLTRREPWSSKNYPEIAEWLKGQQSTIETLIQAAKIEKCRFPISKDIFDFVSVPSLAAMRHWAFLLVRAGNNDLAENSTDEALEKYITILQMAKHIRQQPVMTELLVSIAIEGVAIGQFKRLVVTGDATNESLEFVSKALPELKNTWGNDWPTILDYEKIYTKNSFGRLYQVNEDGKVRFCRSLESFVPKESGITLSYLRGKIWKLTTIWLWFVLPHSPQKAGKLLDEEFTKYYEMADPNYPWPSQSPEFTLPKVSWLPWRFMDSAKPFEFMYHHFHDIYLRTIAGRRGIKILIALRRYKNKTGQWPGALDDIKSIAPVEIFVDPINGSSFVYKLTEENFTLYSKGKNKIDEDGIRRVTFDPNDLKWPKTEEDDILIWPPKTRKIKEENADAEQQ